MQAQSQELEKLGQQLETPAPAQTPTLQSTGQAQRNINPKPRWTCCLERLSAVCETAPPHPQFEYAGLGPGRANDPTARLGFL
jgi:hypothetical protein